MIDHFWVELKYTPIHVEKNPDGDLVVSADEVSINTAHEEALNGCWFCFTPLNADTFGTKCEYDDGLGGVGDQPASAEREEGSGSRED